MAQAREEERLEMEAAKEARMYEQEAYGNQMRMKLETGEDYPDIDDLDEEMSSAGLLKRGRKAKKAETVTSLGTQCGEGWLLAGEMTELIDSGVENIVCLQPFACLPNHVTGKGMIKPLRKHNPLSNICAIDYDPGASDVNQLNRIKLMMATAHKNLEKKTERAAQENAQKE